MKERDDLPDPPDTPGNPDIIGYYAERVTEPSISTEPVPLLIDFDMRSGRAVSPGYGMFPIIGITARCAGVESEIQEVTFMMSEASARNLHLALGAALATVNEP